MTENPYAPPVDGAPGGISEAPRDYGWRIRDGKLLVLAASQLPMIDPFSGGRNVTMFMHELRVRHRPGWLWALPFAGAILFPLLSGGMEMPERLVLAVPGLLLGHIAALAAGAFHSACVVRMFILRRTLRLRKLHGHISTTLFLLVVPGGFLFSAGPDWMRWIPGIAFIGWLLALLIGALFFRRLGCRVISRGFFEIHGMHPEAIRVMSQRDSRE